MALYDRADITTRIRDLLNEAVANYWSDATIAVCINEAQRYLAVNYGAQQAIESLVTIAGNREVVFAGFFAAHVEVADPSGLAKPLARISKAQYGRHHVEGPRPQYYYQEESNLIIDPEPNDTYSLTAYTLASSTDMATGAAVPSIAAIFIPALILLSTALCLKNELSEAGYQALVDIAAKKASHANYDFSVVAPDGVANLIGRQ